MDKVTKSQKRLLIAIQELKNKNGVYPTLREIAEYIKGSAGGVCTAVTILTRQGLISKDSRGTICKVVTNVRVVASTQGKSRTKKERIEDRDADINTINVWLTKPILSSK